MTHRSPALAAFLSFLFPGLGQIYAGRTRRGVIWAIPMLIVVVAAVLVLLGGSRSLTTFLSADKALALLVLDVVLLIYHVAAMVDAYLVCGRAPTGVISPASPRTGVVALGALIVLAVCLHGVPGAFGLAYYGFASSFRGDTGVIVPASFAPQTLAPSTLPPTSSASPTTAPSSVATTPGSATPGSATPKATGTQAPSSQAADTA